MTLDWQLDVESFPWCHSHRWYIDLCFRASLKTLSENHSMYLPANRNVSSNQTDLNEMDPPTKISNLSTPYQLLERGISLEHIFKHHSACHRQLCMIPSSFRISQSLNKRACVRAVSFCLQLVDTAPTSVTSDPTTRDTNGLVEVTTTHVHTAAITRLQCPTWNMSDESANSSSLSIVNSPNGNTAPRDVQMSHLTIRRKFSSWHKVCYCVYEHNIIGPPLQLLRFEPIVPLHQYSSAINDINHSFQLMDVFMDVTWKTH